MRLFIAIGFGADTKERLKALREQLRFQSRGGNFTPDENLHLTLAFIGEVGPKQAERINAIVNSVSFGPLKVSVERLGFFSRGTLWWAGLAANGPLMELQRELADKLTQGGFEIDSREFHPHITLGRKVVTECKPWPFEPFGETVTRLDIMKSERIGGRLTYTAINGTSCSGPRVGG